MSQLVALSLSIGVLGGIATYIFLAWMPHYLIWAAFIAWACYFGTGGNTEALKKTITCNIFGAICAWVAALLIVSAGGGAGLNAIIVGATVLVLCLGAHVSALSSIPASVYGYAAVFAFLLGNPSANLTKDNLMSASPANALIAVAASMVIGAIFGLLSGKLAGALGKS
ncbi:MAG TPA: DUF1097 domain-containing protein [Gemmatimonadales bacterium]|nr:DUF1097 domain-containing protein [Gemmatimonadales bacterium]